MATDDAAAPGQRRWHEEARREQSWRVKNLGHLIHGSQHSASADSVTIGTPRLYEAFTRTMFLGRRRGIYRGLVAASGVKPGDRVIDVGCGTGYFARLLGTAVETTGAVVGIDAAPEMLEYAARHARALANCDFKLGKAESLPVASGTADVVVSALVLHHLPPEAQSAAASEMRRVLRPGGIALIADLEVTEPGFRTRLLMQVTGLKHMRRHAPSLEPLLAAAGFRDVRTGRSGEWLGYARGINP
jgi:ubiquinone/menaquinone biosynthesis C-methylase UbiE